ncbi:MAG: KxYKxGKxW signal peptide domain-containing protein [Bacteroidetes bacterium]|nr:KxYKxGKxW signal peptide domain-containing protein [Bacteroidota bacterium]
MFLWKSGKLWVKGFV